MRLSYQLLLTAAVLLITATNAAATSSMAPPSNVQITAYPELNNEEQVWIFPVDSLVVMANWRDFRLGYRQIGVGRSVDGGQTWSDSLISFDMQVFGSDAGQSDPTLTCDRLGSFIMTALDYDAWGTTGLSTISVYRSIDQGLSWTGPVPAMWTGDPDVFEDKQFTTVDRTGGPYDGNFYMSWTRFPNPDRIVLVRSTDDCQSFEDTVVIGPAQSSTGCGSYVVDAGQFSNPLVAPNGDVHVFWVGYSLDSSDECTGYSAMKHVVSTDGGVSFTSPSPLFPVSGNMTADGGIATYNQPACDADLTGGPFGGNIYIAFTNLGPEDEYHSDIDFVRSTDNGVTWSERYMINDDTNTVEIDNFHPWLVVNDEGVIVVVFYDQRFDPPGYYWFDCLAAYSFDGGETFTTNHRLSGSS